MEKFIATNKQINSKNLHEFESNLAKEVNLSKRILEGRPANQLSGSANKQVAAHAGSMIVSPGSNKITGR